MVKFCYFNNELMRCDDATIEKYNLEVVKQISDEEFEKYGNYYIKVNEIVLGINPIETIRDEINALKQNLAETDYITLKYIEGVMSEEDYLKAKVERQGWRDRINVLEKELENLG